MKCSCRLTCTYYYYKHSWGVGTRLLISPVNKDSSWEVSCTCILLVNVSTRFMVTICVSDLPFLEEVTTFPHLKHVANETPSVYLVFLRCFSNVGIMQACLFSENTYFQTRKKTLYSAQNMYMYTVHVLRSAVNESMYTKHVCHSCTHVRCVRDIDGSMYVLNLITNN